MTNNTPPIGPPLPPSEPPAPLASTRPSLSLPGPLLATWFGSGYLPKAPGTWGSLAALPYAWIIMKMGGQNALLAAIVVVFSVGLWASKDYMARTKTHDPGAIVIDEVVGQWIVLLAAPLDPALYIFGFVLFRLFDIFKPWPISKADQSIPGAMGVMIDDVIAGLFGLAVLVLVNLYLRPYVQGPF